MENIHTYIIWLKNIRNYVAALFSKKFEFQMTASL